MSHNENHNPVSSLLSVSQSPDLTDERRLTIVTPAAIAVSASSSQLGTFPATSPFPSKFPHETLSRADEDPRREDAVVHETNRERADHDELDAIRPFMAIPAAAIVVVAVATIGATDEIPFNIAVFFLLWGIFFLLLLRVQFFV